jgi:hypothetical protein
VSDHYSHFTSPTSIPNILPLQKQAKPVCRKQGAIRHQLKDLLYLRYQLVYLLIGGIGGYG